MASRSLSQWDISALNLGQLEKKFKKMDRTIQGKLLRKVTRESAKRLKQEVITNVSGDPVAVQTGVTLAAFKKAKIRSTGGRRRIRIGMVMPTREELDIPPRDKEKHFYPSALEYGTPTLKPRRFIRRAVDDNAAREQAIMARELGGRIAAMWRSK